MSRWARFRRHPSRDELLAWLDGERPDLDEHLATCEVCAVALEELAAPSGGPIAEALAAFYRAPDDLSERLEQRVADRLDSMVMIEVMTDLFGAGMETSKLLLTEEPPHE
ncbi:MAG: hypothetical protein AAGA93_07540 [Actinomycetota bacterium]